MNNPYNAYNYKPYHLDQSFNNSDQNLYQKSSSKLYSSEKFSHSDLPSISSHHKPQVSATQLYSNLNNSLDGLFSKIQALKEEHVTEQKVQKVVKKPNMDVSGFPMPNLVHNQFLKGKNFPGPITIKPRQKHVPHEVQNLKELNKSNEDNKAVSPPTQATLSHTTSVQNLKPQKNEQEVLTPKIVVSNAKNDLSDCHFVAPPQSKQQKNAFHSNNNFLKQGLMNMQNMHMKVSMEVPSQFYHNQKKGKNHLSLDNIIQKQANETDICRKSIVFNQAVTLKDFQLGKLVGSGKFGDVHICFHKATGSLFALKKIFKSTIKQYNMVTQFTRQLKIHYRLDHPNIIKLYTHFEDEYHVFLIMEYAEGGILMDKLKCTEQVASRFVDQTIDAVQYLHKLKIAHRDIKPENIVMQFGSVLKLCDFGWASYYQNQMKTTFCGTLDYLSPQMKEGGQYDNSVDIWSIGVLTYQLLTGNPPYRKQLMLSMKNGIGPSKPGSRKVNWNVNYPPFISPMAQSFIRNLLKQNPEDRATLRFCSTHTFIKKYQQDMETVFLLYPEFQKIIA